MNRTWLVHFEEGKLGAFFHHCNVEPPKSMPKTKWSFVACYRCLLVSSLWRTDPEHVSDDSPKVLVEKVARSAADDPQIEVVRHDPKQHLTRDVLLRHRPRGAAGRDRGVPYLEPHVGWRLQFQNVNLNDQRAVSEQGKHCKVTKSCRFKRTARVAVTDVRLILISRTPDNHLHSQSSTTDFYCLLNATNVPIAEQWTAWLADV